jgi:hypothetical protein
MGKSWKGANAWKYKKDKNFQKKQKQKNKSFHAHLKSDDAGFESAPNMDYDPPDFQQDR